MSTYRTSFSPEDHGFAWANNFKGEDIVASWLAQELITLQSASYMIGLIHGGPARQLTAGMLDITTDEMIEQLGDLLDGGGLSAGVCLAALDRYHHGQSPWKRKPGKKSNNFARLAADHFGVFGDWSRLVEMISDMNRPDVTHAWNQARSLGDLTSAGWWPQVRCRLRQGTPVPITLYRSRWNPFSNHVVVVTGCRESGDPVRARLDFYDPNHPGVATRLVIDFGRQGSFRLEPKSTYGPGWRKVRGFKLVRSSLEHDAASRELAAQLAAL